MNAVIDVQHLKKFLIMKQHYRMFPLPLKKGKYSAFLAQVVLVKLLQLKY